MTGSIEMLNVLGAVVAVVIHVLVIAVFVARLGGKPAIEHWLGLLTIGTIVPLGYLFVTGVTLHRPALYFIQVGLMIAYLIVELLLDYVYRVDFRCDRRIVIPYIILFYAGTGGMIGVAGLAGQAWLCVAVSSFLIMMALSIVQRRITGQ